jgi:3-oxoacyl-[acyl-carrier-protein] synthase-3
VLFGDGAGALVLTGRETPGGVLSGVLRSNGAGHDFLTLPTVGSLDIQVAGITPNGRKLHKLHMDGGEVFKFATRVIGDSIRQAVAQAGIRLQDLKLIVPHQANERILQAAAKSLNMDTSLFMSNIAKYGNTSAASIPIALVEAVEQGRIHADDYIALVGFGGGLTWASMVIQWSGPQAETRFGEPRRQAFYLWSGVRRAFRRFTDRFMRRRPPKR